MVFWQLSGKFVGHDTEAATADPAAQAAPKIRCRNAILVKDKFEFDKEISQMILNMSMAYPSYTLLT